MMLHKMYTGVLTNLLVPIIQVWWKRVRNYLCALQYDMVNEKQGEKSSNSNKTISMEQSQIGQPKMNMIWEV